METVINPPSRHGRHAEGTAGLSLRITPELKSKLFAMAARKKRTPSDFIRIELTKIASRA